MSGIPRGWARVALGDVADIRLGKMLDRARTAGTPHRYLRNVNVRWDSVDTSDLLTMPFKDGELERYGIRPGDLLVCEGGEPGRAAIWTLGKTDLKYQKALHRVRLAEGITGRWVMFSLMHDASTGQLSRRFTGSTIAHLPREKLVEYEVTVPPASEQGRIIEALDSHLSRLEAAVASLERAQTRLKAYRASVLKAAVEGRLVPTDAEIARKEGHLYEPADVLLQRILKDRRHRWEEAELAKMKAAGKTPKDEKWKSRYSQPEPVDPLDLPVLPDGWCWTRVSSAGTVQLGRQRAPQHHRGEHMRPYLRVANVFEDRIDTADVLTMNFSPKEFEVYRLEHGDILLNEGQSPHLVGRSAMYRGEVPGACFQNTLVRFKASSGVDPGYALIVFRAQLHARRYMRIAQITTNIAHLGAGRFGEVEFPLPPLQEQRRIVMEVERLMSVADAADQSLDHERLRCARLRQSILAWAFDGKLVAQDPADEPANLLLARISAERSAALPATPTAKRSRKLKAAS